jgi:hypothetical protein
MAGGFGLVFTAVAIAGRSALYRAMGGTGQALEAAPTYSVIMFAGSIPIWIVALLSPALRGAGNGALAAQLFQARSDRRKVVSGTGSGALAAQLLHACADSRKIVGGARSGHVSSFL